MKRSFAIILCVLFVLSLAACKTEEPLAETTDIGMSEVPLAGAYALYTDNKAVDLPADVQNAFDTATASVDDEIVPIAYIGSQVVAGTNHALLCYVTPSGESEPTLKVLIIYADLQGNAEISYMNDFVITDYTEDSADTPETLMGGWNVPDVVTVEPMPDEAQTAFDKASTALDGNDLDAMALLGTQIVAGTNYAVLCRSTLTTAEPVESIQVAVIYADLEGNAEITSLCYVDIADFNG